MEGVCGPYDIALEARGVTHCRTRHSRTRPSGALEHHVRLHMPAPPHDLRLCRP